MSYRSAVSLLVVGAVLLAGCGGDAEVEDAPPVEDVAPDEPSSEEPTADEPSDEEPGDAGDPEDTSSGPAPDPALVADPCGPHEGREAEAFIDVVSPVAEQRVPGEVELVGCSNVFEATVVWELYDGDGRELDRGFTTATCGTGCVGEFRELLDLAAAEGEPYAELHVFAEDMSGQEDRLYLTEIPLLLG